MKILIIIVAILITVGGAGYSYYNRTLYIQAALYSEGHTLTAIPRLRVEEYYDRQQRFPQDNEQAGLSAPHAIFGTSVKHVSVVRDGVVVVQFNEESSNSTMVFTPQVDLDRGTLSWLCSSDSIDKAVLSKLRPHCVYTPATAESELMKGIANQDLNLIRKKLETAVNLEALINGNTPLMLAAKIGNPDIVNLLLAAGAKVDHAFVNIERRTPLMIAISSQRAEVVTVLLSQGASIERTDYSGRTALDYARLTDSRNGDSRFELMVAAQSNPQFAGGARSKNSVVTPAQRRQDDYQLYTQLKSAIGSCYIRQVETLLARNDDYAPGETHQGEPLRVLAGQPECSQALDKFVKGKPTWQQVTYSALQLSVDECNENAGKALLAENPDFNLTDATDGESIIFRALRSGCTEVLNTLLRYPSVARPLQSSLVTDAIRSVPQHALLRTVSILIESGAELNKPDSQGMTPLAAAISHEQPVVAKYLVDAGASLSARTSTGSYPLIEATKKGYHHLVENLIRGGAEVNSQDRLGRTALHSAVANGRRRTVEVLLQAGADPFIQDIDGIDSILMAKSKRYESIQAVLLE